MKSFNFKQFIMLFLIFFIFFGDLFYFKKKVKQILKYLNNFITKNSRKKDLNLCHLILETKVLPLNYFLKSNNEQIFKRN